MASTIWIANEAGHPGYVKAMEIAGPDAQLRPLTLGDVNVFQVDRLLYNLVRGIMKYVQPDDYLIVSGSAIIPALAILLWVRVHKKCNLLQWNASRQEYRLHVIDSDAITDLIDAEIART